MSSSVGDGEAEGEVLYPIIHYKIDKSILMIVVITLLFCCPGRYWLGPREEKNDPPSKQELGSLRLRVCHTQDYVFPSSFYDPLRETVLGIKDGQVCK